MNRHPFDPASFVFGTVFVLLAVAALSGNIEAGRMLDGWGIPVLLIVFGALLLLPARSRLAPGRGDTPARPVPADRGGADRVADDLTHLDDASVEDGPDDQPPGEPDGDDGEAEGGGRPVSGRAGPLDFSTPRIDRSGRGRGSETE